MEHSYVPRPIVLPPLQPAAALRRKAQPNGGYNLTPAYSVGELQDYARAAVTLDRSARGRHPPSLLSIARRHPKLFSKLIGG